MQYGALDDLYGEEGECENDRAVNQVAFSMLINSLLAKGRPEDVLKPQVEFIDRMIAISISLVDKHYPA